VVEKIRPVWAWLPGAVTPTECGTFTWSPGLGRFAYSEEYRARSDANAIDPINLPFTRSTKPTTTTQMNGVFGVIRDAAPEGFGLDLLIAKHGQRDLDEVERMDLSAGDGVGGIEVCPAQEIDRKQSFTPPREEDLRALLIDAGQDESITGVVRQLAGDDDGTSLGGEKPKLTVSCAAADGTEWWIAKLQARNSPRLLPAREYVAMKLAARCGLDVAEVRFERIGLHTVVWVKRFDRKVVQGGVERSLFASAASVLRLDNDTREHPDRSYPKLAYELRRWCGDRHQGFAAQQRELWRRMVFNALVGNYDDHPRNHGLLHSGGTWSLSPAYDIVAMPGTPLVQAMAVNRSGTRVASPETLVVDAPSFSYEHAEAWDKLREMAAIVNASWRALYDEHCEVSGEEQERQRPAFQLAEAVDAGSATLDPAGFIGRRNRRAGGSTQH